MTEEEGPSGRVFESSPAAQRSDSGIGAADNSGNYLDDSRDRYYSVSEAGKILNVSESRVRQLARSGRLEGQRTEGVWKLFRYSVHAFRDQKRERELPKGASEGTLEGRQLLEELRALERELGRLEGRLELTAQAESTVREQLERERRERLEDVERERGERMAAQEQAEQLRREMEEAERRVGLLEAGRGEAQEEASRLRAELEAERSKGFFRRLFGG